MEFEEIKGNLFDHMDQKAAYAHCIANDDNYGAGIAPIFILKVFKQKQILTEELKSNPWDLTKTGWCCIIAEENKPIACHLITKKHTFGKPNYSTIRTAIVNMRDKLKKIDAWNKHLCMPRIGCGLDRLSWPIVRDIIKEVFKDDDVKISVYYL
jgi:hypothetical protein